MIQIRLALVTGASSGLGKALAYALAEQGIPLILVARNVSAIPKDLKVPVEIFACDLSDPKERRRLSERVRTIRPDLIINNAGFGLYGPVLSHTLDANAEMIRVNIDALLELTYEGAQALVAAGEKGTIVNISSAAAFTSYPTFAVYAASKAFVNNFSEGLEAELRPKGVRVLTVCPGPIATDFIA
ncbi:MAG: SDR family NAD(P)-dependent oxidoreductase, partial [Candidatus Melainabacteria bacterium]|nr:SDR family NAD(P)-dependent oxidoreductase [Candidatus Melainabacteria bacterium]